MNQRLNLEMHEIFQNYIKLLARPDMDKINYLRSHSSQTLVYVLRAIFNPNIKFLIKEIPKYKPSMHPLPLTTLFIEMKSIYLFEDGNPKRSKNLSYPRMTKILIQMLESLSNKEAKVLEAVLMKNTTFVPYLTAEIAEAAFPGKIL